MDQSTENRPRHLKVIESPKSLSGRRVSFKVTASQRQLLLHSLRRAGLEELLCETQEMKAAQTVVISTGGSIHALEELLSLDLKNKDAIEFEALVKDLNGPGDLLHGEELKLLLGLSRPRPARILYRGLKRLLAITLGMLGIILLYVPKIMIASQISLKGIQPVQAKYGKIYLFFLWNRSLTHRVFNSFVISKALVLGDIELIGPELKCYLPHAYEVSLRKLFGVGIVPYTDFDESRSHWPSWLKDLYYCQNEGPLLDLRAIFSLFHKK